MKRRATENIISRGDKVYMENMIRENKLMPNFNPIPHTVTGKNGSENV